MWVSQHRAKLTRGIKSTLGVEKSFPDRLPHESTEANRIKGTFRGLYYERDAEPSQRAPL